MKLKTTLLGKTYEFKSIKQVWEIQTQDEKINKFSAFFHVLAFAFNALKKYLF